MPIKTYLYINLYLYYQRKRKRKEDSVQRSNLRPNLRPTTLTYDIEGICFILLILIFLLTLPNLAFYSSKTRVIGRILTKKILQTKLGLEVGFLAEYSENRELFQSLVSKYATILGNWHSFHLVFSADSAFYSRPSSVVLGACFKIFPQLTFQKAVFVNRFYPGKCDLEKQNRN